MYVRGLRGKEAPGDAAENMLWAQGVRQESQEEAEISEKKEIRDSAGVSV